MSIEKGKNYTGSEDVYRNLSKERELLERALLLLDYSEMRSDSLATEIELCLAEPVVAESAFVVVNENGNYMRVNPKREPLSYSEILKEFALEPEAYECEWRWFHEGVRFAEEHHQIIGDSNGNQ